MNAFFPIQPGLEPVLADELREAGFAPQVEPGGVRVAGEVERLVPLAWTLRTPTACYLELVEGPARSPDELAGLVRRVAWKPWLLPTAKLTVEVSSKGSRLRFADAIAGRVSGALQEARKGPRVPEYDKRATLPQTLRVRIHDDVALLSLDAGGELLHRRGWREDSHAAPLRENLAAALLRLCRWDRVEPFYDPFCGVGTFPIEAALWAAGRSPFGRRRFAAEEWPAVKARPPKPGKKVRNDRILGSDKEPRALAACLANAQRAAVEPAWRQLEIGDIQPPAARGTLVTNPPYGQRLGQNVRGLYARFGAVLRERFGGWSIFFLCPDPELARAVDRRVERLLTFPNGGIRVGVWALEP